MNSGRKRKDGESLAATHEDEEAHVFPRTARPTARKALWQSRMQSKEAHSDTEHEQDSATYDSMVTAQRTPMVIDPFFAAATPTQNRPSRSPTSPKFLPNNPLSYSAMSAQHPYPALQVPRKRFPTLREQKAGKAAPSLAELQEASHIQPQPTNGPPASDATDASGNDTRDQVPSSGSESPATPPKGKRSHDAYTAGQDFEENFEEDFEEDGTRDAEGETDEEDVVVSVETPPPVKRKRGRPKGNNTKNKNVQPKKSKK